jgi:hypothetical protein
MTIRVTIPDQAKGRHDVSGRAGFRLQVLVQSVIALSSWSFSPNHRRNIA